METLLKLLTVLGLGSIELWASVPAGFGLELRPVATAVASALGAILGALAVTALGEGVQSRLLRTRRDGGRNRRIAGIGRRYGAAGLGLLAPLLVGAPLGTALGLALGVPASRLLPWMCFGAVLWSAALTAAATLGLAGVEGVR